MQGENVCNFIFLL